MSQKILSLSVVLTFVYIFSVVFFERNELMFGSYFLVGPAVYVLFHSIASKQREMRFNILDAFAVAWYLYSLLHIEYSNVQCFAHNDVTLNSSLLAMYMLIRLKPVPEKRLFKLFSAVLLVFGISQEVLFVGQQFDVFAKSSNMFVSVGSFAGLGPFSVFVGFVALFAIWGLVNISKEKDLLSRFLYISSIVFVLLLLFIAPHTQSRTAWVIIALGCGIVVAFQYKDLLRERVFSNRRIVVLSSVVFVVVSMTGAYLMYDMKKDSANGRVIVWDVVLGVVNEKPIMGQGVDALQMRYLDWQSKWFTEERRSADEVKIAGTVIRCYNDFLLEWVEKGIVGLVFLVSLFVSGLVMLRKNKTAFISLWLAVIVCTIVSSLVTFSYSLPYIALIFFVILGFIGNQAKRTLFSFSAPKPFQIGFPLVAGAFFGGICLLAFDFSSDNSNRLNELRMISNDFDEIVRNSEEDLNAVKSNQLAYSSYIVALYNLERYEDCIVEINSYNKKIADDRIYQLLGDCYMETAQYDKAESAYRKQYSMIPNRFFPLYKLFHLYQKSGNGEMAKKVAETIVYKPVKIHSPAIRDMKKEMQEFLSSKKL